QLFVYLRGRIKAEWLILWPAGLSGYADGCVLYEELFIEEITSEERYIRLRCDREVRKRHRPALYDQRLDAAHPGDGGVGRVVATQESEVDRPVCFQGFCKGKGNGIDGVAVTGRLVCRSD